jgi:hypothetical protein
VTSLVAAGDSSVRPCWQTTHRPKWGGPGGHRWRPGHRQVVFSLKAVSFDALQDVSIVCSQYHVIYGCLMASNSVMTPSITPQPPTHGDQLWRRDSPPPARLHYRCVYAPVVQIRRALPEYPTWNQSRRVKMPGPSSPAGHQPRAERRPSSLMPPPRPPAGGSPPPGRSVLSPVRTRSPPAR